MRLKSSFLFLLTLLPLLSTANPITATDNEISAGVTIPVINYGEPGLDYDTSSPVSNKGNTTVGMELSLSTMRNLFHIQNLYFHASVSYSYSQLYYRGYTMFRHLPFNMYQPSHIFNINIDAGKGFFINRKAVFIPYVTVGYHEWQRGELNGNEWDETYSNYFTGPGIKLQYALNSRTVISLKASVSAVIHGKIYTRNAGFQYNDTTRFHTTAMENADVSADYRISQHVHLYGGFSFTHFNYTGGDFSNLMFYHGQQFHMYEPFSWTNVFAMKLGVAYGF